MAAMATNPSDYKSSEDYTERYLFKADWYDPEACFTKHFYLNYFPSDNAVELFDIDTNRTFLRRNYVPGVTFKDMYVGSSIRIYGRLIKIVDYAEERTQRIISAMRQKTFAMLKPGTSAKFGSVISCIEKCGFDILKLRMCKLTRDQAIAFYEKYKTDPIMSVLLDKVTSGDVIAIEMVGPDAVGKWREIIGPRDPIQARVTSPTSLRAIYGVEIANNGFHGADSEKEAERETQFFFADAQKHRLPAVSPTYRNSTLCLVKPHVIKNGQLGEALSAITDEGFIVTAMISVALSVINAEEFFEIYRGVVDDFAGMIAEITSGVCVALEVTGASDDVKAFCSFREFCGPQDPNIARQIRGKSLRARFGLDTIKNGVHCTDLIDDVVSDLEYFFKILIE